MAWGKVVQVSAKKNMQIRRCKVKGKSRCRNDVNPNVAVERVSQYVSVVTERLIAAVALYFSRCFRFHGSSLSPIFLLDICNIYQLCFV